MQDRIARQFQSLRIRVEASYNRQPNNPFNALLGNVPQANTTPIEERHAQLEELERKVEAGEITEGEYLEACNALRS